MPGFNLRNDRKWTPRTQTGWEVCGLYNHKLHPNKGAREKVSRSYTALNRLAPGGATEGYSVGWDWDFYVLEGDLQVGGRILGPCDHVIIEANETFRCKSKNGCTLFAVGHDIPPREPQ